jgi:hypothetical protein
MNAAAPEGAPSRRIRKGKTALAPPCLGEALRRGTLIFVEIRVFSCRGFLISRKIKHMTG